MKTVYADENSVEGKPCINIESKSLELTIKLYSFHDINMKFLVVVTPPSIYHYASCKKINAWKISDVTGGECKYRE